MKPYRKKLYSVAYQVTVQLMAYGRYGNSFDAACKVLRKRAPGFQESTYRRLLQTLTKAYDLAAAAVPKHIHRDGSSSPFAKFEDVDFEACLREVDQVAPGRYLGSKRAILGFVIFWHYLK